MGFLYPHRENLAKIITEGSLTSRYMIPGWKLGDTASTVTPAANQIHAIGIYVNPTWAFDRISVEVTTGGTGGHVGRLGIYNATVDAKGGLTPGSLLVDAGEIAVDSTGVVEKTISQTLSGWYFLAFSVQSGVYRSPGGSNIHPPYQDGHSSFALNNPTANAGSILLSGADAGYSTTALPATFPAITGVATAPRAMVMLRTSD